LVVNGSGVANPEPRDPRIQEALHPALLRQLPSFQGPPAFFSPTPKSGRKLLLKRMNSYFMSFSTVKQKSAGYPNQDFTYPTTVQ
jgi:hypothetical protein